MFTASKEILDMKIEYNFPKFDNIERARVFFAELSETKLKKPQKYLHGTLLESLRAINDPPKTCPESSESNMALFNNICVVDGFFN